MWTKMADAPRKPGYRGTARDLGLTYVNLTGGSMPDWVVEGKTPPRGAYKKLDDLGWSR